MMSSDEMIAEQKRFNLLSQSIQVNGKMMYLGCLLQRAAENFPEKNALIYQDRFVSYRTLYYYAVQFSHVLCAKGVKPRDRVLLFFENSIAFYVGYFGILQCGAVVVPLNVFLHEREVAHVINDAQPSLIVTSQELAQRLAKINGTHLPPIVTEVDMLLEGEPPAEIPSYDIVQLDSHEMAVLLYTSGTTGLPKGVMLSSENALTNVMQSVARFRYIGIERVFAILPLFHSFAQNTCIWSPFFMGCIVIVVHKIERRAILDNMKHKPTVLLGVPALYGLLALLKTVPLSSVRYFISGGDALPDKIRSVFALLYRRKLCNGYGLTETSPVIAGDLDDMTEPTSNVGRPLIGLSCAIRDEDGNDLLRYQIGELWVKGNNVMLGYYNNPELTKDVIHDGWLRTGDLAYIDKRGKIVITGRIKDLIIHKGLNIYPQEIENIIISYPNVLFAGVIGQDDEEAGQIPIAYVQLRVEEDEIEDSLRKLCLKNLAPYKIPRDFICSTQPLPTTSTGKVDKKILRKLHVQKK